MDWLCVHNDSSPEPSGGVVEHWSMVYDRVQDLQRGLRGFSESQLRCARAKSNSLEGLGSGLFVSRAGIKLAEIDACTGFQLLPGLPFHAADICASPGGFSDYMLWKRGPHVLNKIYVVSLLHPMAPRFGIPCNDPRIQIENGPENNTTGDITHACVRRAFVAAARGASLVTADAGFPAHDISQPCVFEGSQETRLLALLLAQVSIALQILDPGGNMVCKIYGASNPVTRAVIHLCCHMFHTVSIFKPLSSRPANSERYLVCMHLLTPSSSHGPRASEITGTLESVLHSNHVTSAADLIHGVLCNRQMYNRIENYITSMNLKHASAQVTALERMHHHLHYTWSAKTHDPENKQTQKQQRHQLLHDWQLLDRLLINRSTT